MIELAGMPRLVRNSVGRTPSSAAFEFDFCLDVLLRFDVKTWNSLLRPNVKGKSGGRGRPPHIGWN
jgi:hypothetical protein